jgi:tRNA U54 and U55 pseudouridine synthase Pus10
LESSEVLNKALNLLKNYPLCDNCLGRCFARLGYGLDNKERGKAIKISLILEIDKRIKEHKIQDLLQIKEVLFNMNEVAKPFFRLYFREEEFQNRPCYICNNELDEIKKDFMNKAMEELNKLSKPTFVLGVRLSESIRIREEEFSSKNNLIDYETIKNEIKREVGKELAKLGFSVDIDNPEVELIYDLDSRSVISRKKIKKILYIYNRLSRNIPISSWYSKQGKSLESLLGKQIIVPFSELSEVRIIDDYYLIIEDYEVDEKVIEGYYLKKVGKIIGKEVSVLMNSKPSKRIYRVLIYSTKEIKDAIKLYDNLYDLHISVSSTDELKEKLKSIEGEILAIDLIDSEGKHKRALNALINKEKSIEG